VDPPELASHVFDSDLQGAGLMTDSMMEKPLLRGKLHLWAAALALLAGAWLLLRASTPTATIASLIYSLALVAMFAISALYHIPHWTKETRLRLRQLDHAAIFFLIAGTATPLFALCLTGESRSHALTLIWSGALVGILQTLFWIHAPKSLVAALYVGLGWLTTPYLKQMAPAVGSTGALLLVSGGIIYSLGALTYSVRRPNPVPHIFGYHEVFHALVIVAVICHYLAIYRVVANAA